MFNKNRIRLLSALAVILVIGFFLVINNLRPVSERKKKGRERLDSKIEWQKINNRISILSDSIKDFPENYNLFYQRARLYKSINEYGKAIDDYSIFITGTNSQDLKTKAKNELESVKNVKRFLDKQNN